MARAVPFLLVALALLLHAAHVRERAWTELRDAPKLHDFATFDAAVAAAAEGADPYDPAALLEHRRSPEPRVLSPFFYPPAFLVSMAWTQSASPAEASRTWFWLGEGALLAALVAYASMVGRSSAALSFALLLAALSCVPDHLRFGQANAFPLLFVVLSLWAFTLFRDRLAGAALGVAVALKFLPLAVLVAFAAQRRWQAVGWTLGVFAALQLAAVAAAPVAGLDGSTLAAAALDFPLRVVPALVSGELAPPFPVDAFPNLSLASVFARFLGEDGELARRSLGGALHVAATLALLGVLAYSAGRVAPARRPGAFAALAVLPMLLAPRYLFDHHLLLVLPALAWPLGRLLDGRAPRWLAYALLPTLAVLAWGMEDLRHRAGPPGSAAERWLWDVKTIAWVSLLAIACLLAYVERRRHVDCAP